MNITQKFKRKSGAPRCPGCGQPIASDSNFCYACCHFLTENKTHLLPAESVTGAEIQNVLMLHEKETDIQHQTKRYKIAQGFFWLGFFCLILSFIIFFIDQNLFIWLFLGAFVLGGLYKVIEPRNTAHMLSEGQQNRLIENYLVPQALQAIFEDEVSYQPQGTLPKGLIEKYPFYSRKFDTYEGSQLVTGTYHNTPIMMSRVYLEYTLHDEGTTEKRKLFEGHCLYAETNLRPIGELRLYARDFTDVSHWGTDQNGTTFNDCFLCGKTSLKVINALLTPALQEKLLRLRQKDCRFCFFLQPNGHLFIAIQEHNTLALSAKHLDDNKHTISKLLTYPVQLLDILLSECPK